MNTAEENGMGKNIDVSMAPKVVPARYTGLVGLTGGKLRPTTMKQSDKRSCVLAGIVKYRKPVTKMGRYIGMAKYTGAVKYTVSMSTWNKKQNT